jgi:hypothetical protein
MRLRIDPWDPEYGASAEIDPDLEEPVGLELAVEVHEAWQPIPAPAREALPCCAFVDGVRRIASLASHSLRSTLPPTGRRWLGSTGRLLATSSLAKATTARRWRP